MPYTYILKTTMLLLLCVQLFNVCLYVPAWMHPGHVKADLTESILELILEGITNDANTMRTYDEGSPSSPSFAEEILEDLHLTKASKLDFTLSVFSQVQHNYYRYTADLKNHVFAVVYPPPDFC